MKSRRAEKLDELLEKRNLNGFLKVENSEDSNLYYLTQFEVEDPVVYLRTQGKSVLMVPPLEYSRAEKEAEVDEVRNTMEFEEGDIREDEEAKFSALIHLLEEYGVKKPGVPREFGLYKAEKLREEGYDLQAVEDVIIKARKVKEQKEIEKIREAQRATEATMEKAEQILKQAEVEDGKLHLNGEVLTSEKMRAELHKELLEHDFSLTDTIVACGRDGADPHQTGSGALKPNKPIIIDIFPRHPSGYHGDMTRTFVKGEIPERVKEMKEAVMKAQKAALEALETENSITGEELNDTVCEVLEDHGYGTLRQGNIESGMLHSSGHGIGLDIHEPPRLGPSGGELKPVNVVTVEPGLYNPEIGGVRIEDMILITEDGYENFNSMHKQMQID